MTVAPSLLFSCCAGDVGCHLGAILDVSSQGAEAVLAFYKRAARLKLNDAGEEVQEETR